MQQLLPQVYLKYKVVAINFLGFFSRHKLYQNRTLYVSVTNSFVC